MISQVRTLEWRDLIVFIKKESAGTNWIALMPE